MLPHHNRLSFVKTWESKLHLSSHIHDITVFIYSLLIVMSRCIISIIQRDFLFCFLSVKYHQRDHDLPNPISHFFASIPSLSQDMYNCDKIKRRRNVSKSRTLVLMQPYLLVYYTWYIVWFYSHETFIKNGSKVHWIVQREEKIIDILMVSNVSRIVKDSSRSPSL